MKRVFLGLLIFFLLSFAFATENEQLTITTYYPSPYGSYNELSTYNSTYLATEGGSVGIGTKSPGAKLHVVGASASNAFVVGTATATDIGVVIKPGYAAGIASIQGTNSGLTMPASLSINPEGGNVGVGTASPQAKLDVSGNAVVSGTLAVSGLQISPTAGYRDCAWTGWTPVSNNQWVCSAGYFISRIEQKPLGGANPSMRIYCCRL